MNSEERRYSNGASKKQWLEAKEEIRKVLIDVASKDQLITYGDLADSIESIPISAQDTALAELLGDVSISENELGHGLLSALVINQENNRPGAGFFELARSLGRLGENEDEDVFWFKEISGLHLRWRPPSTDVRKRKRLLGK